mmetsp:Transcript_22872/g.58339  ORF Transcript_22872/g.58339 Transcript_22872/m.58339 type:complete len:235 (-) Transcript_22872:364-1068(-)
MRRLAVLALEPPLLSSLFAGGEVGRDAQEVGLNLALPIARVRYAGHVPAANLLEVVHPGRDRQLEFLPNLPISDDLQNAARRNGRELLQWLAVPVVDVEVGHGDEPADALGVVRWPEHALAPGVEEPEDGAHHVHEAPDLLDALAFAQPLDDHALLDGHQAGLGAVCLERRRAGGRALADEVRGAGERRFAGAERHRQAGPERPELLPHPRRRGLRPRVRAARRAGEAAREVRH